MQWLSNVILYKGRKKSFTLVELVIVIAILAILAGLGTSQFVVSIKKGRDA